MRDAIPRDVRDKVLRRDGARCGYCGGFTQSIHLDHVYPVALGGLNTVANLVVACPLCNARKGVQSRVLPTYSGLKVDCQECGLSLPLRDFQCVGTDATDADWSIDQQGPFGWCVRCTDLRREISAWDAMAYRYEMAA